MNDESQTYLKHPFAWRNGTPLPCRVQRLRYKTLREIGPQAFTEILSRIFVGSLDRADQAHVADLGALGAAQRLMAGASAKWKTPSGKLEGFFNEPEWWRVGCLENGAVAGLVAASIFEGCAKNGLEEGAIYYIGVVPEHRGNGYVNDLLLEATRVLTDVGVWCIFGDTGVENLPMIKAFETVGYRSDGKPRARPIRTQIIPA